ncbi:hypothetical protein LAV_00122 [Sphingobium phage Lacusarx]|uniref:Uncharacterized protein n=1 Tax=Sphingobium phage Lacusarx TaxID=1980139 RepID=A0A1W6DWV5_9CAUD|nr:hypothetical protein FDH44_gp181 [Sphingobium phage Lacusarx]ARK07497.1 hypothetical protein LAV_00122 [Sphingobium phage Lacusarx]
MSDRIYDNPNHPHYGPARRLHVMLLQLGGDGSYSVMDNKYAAIFDVPWDWSLSQLLTADWPEPQAQRFIMKRTLSIRLQG